VIDTIGYGYATVAAKPVVIAPLLILELCLLFLPQVLLQPLTDGFADATRGRGAGWEEVARDVETLGGYNAVELAALRVPLMRMPALMPVAADDEIDQLPWNRQADNAPGWLVLGAAGLAVGLGLGVAALHQLLAAAATGARSMAEALGPRSIARMARDLGSWFVLVFGMLILLAQPMVVMTVAGIAFGFPEIAILWLLLVVPFAWGYIHFYFSIPALALERNGAAHSLRASYRVVRAGFWQSVQFIAISLLISTGLTYALQSIATNAPGILLALLLNAVVATGLLIAAMLFYRDRAARPGLSNATPGR
jgi:hypothetical protein